jgi:transposase
LKNTHDSRPFAPDPGPQSYRFDPRFDRLCPANNAIKEGKVRGDEELQEGFIMLVSAGDRVPSEHPLRAIRKMVDEALSEMSPLLTSLYHERGRASIPPEYLLRAQLLQILYAIPSERRLCEHIEYNFLFRWFVGLPLTEPMWHHSSFTKNRDRLLSAGVAEVFHSQIRSQAEAHRLLSREHFSCDGTLLEAAASLNRLLKKGRPAALDCFTPLSFGGRIG